MVSKRPMNRELLFSVNFVIGHMPMKPTDWQATSKETSATGVRKNPRVSKLKNF